MNTEQERAEFEAWYRLHHGIRDVYGRDSSGEYTDKQVQGAFNVWQARAALAAQNQGEVKSLREMLGELRRAQRVAMGWPPGPTLRDMTGEMTADDIAVGAAAQQPAAQSPDDARDAKRYRLLRRKVCIVGGKFHILNLDPRYIAPDAAVELDAAIDAELAKVGAA